MKKELSMPLMEHVAELRKRLIRVILIFALFLVLGLWIAPVLLLFLKENTPALDFTWNAFSPWDGVRVYMTLGVVLAIVLTLPFALFQAWGFMNVGLKAKEQRIVLRMIPLTLLCFALGFLFAYFIVFPMCFKFMDSINSRMGLTETYGIAAYFGFLFNIVIPISLAFELPLIVIVLTKIQILSPKRLRQFRRYAYLILVIISAMISPPELLSHLIVAIPLIGLYEVSIWLSHTVDRKNKFAQAAEVPYGYQHE